MRRTSFKLLLCTLCAVVLISSVGVYAIWQYPSEIVNTVSKEIPLKLVEFSWEGAEVLPNDVEGENHGWLYRIRDAFHYFSATDKIGRAHV